MKLHNMLPFRPSAWMGSALMLSTILGANALSQEYCSTENTGSSFAAVNDIYQSNGACHDTCDGQYAFAIVQWQNCWCSNYIPAQQSDVSNCDKKCPGYPDEFCGNPDTGYFGYIALDTAPSGTAGAAAASSTSSPSPTSTSTSTPTPTSTTTSSQQPTTSSAATSSTSAPTVEVVASPVTSVFMTTISGAVVTQTVTSTPQVVSGSHSGDHLQVQQDNGLGAGAIAGVVLGVLLGLALIGLAAFLLWRRRQRRNNADNQAQAANVAGSNREMQRNVSVLSKAGLLGGVRPGTGEPDYDESYGMTGSNSVRHSMMFGGADGISPVSPLDSSHSGSSRRPSKPMVYDQRLNPSALFANQEANGSRISMQDTQDYSRPLGVMNPDPRSSFESRLSHQ